MGIMGRVGFYKFLIGFPVFVFVFFAFCWSSKKLNKSYGVKFEANILYFYYIFYLVIRKIINYLQVPTWSKFFCPELFPFQIIHCFSFFIVQV